MSPSFCLLSLFIYSSLRTCFPVCFGSVYLVASAGVVANQLCETSNKNNNNVCDLVLVCFFAVAFLRFVRAI